MIVVFGTICLDRVLRIERFPPQGGYAEVLEESLHLGGEAANTANALRHWGAEIALVGNALGQGPEAVELKRRLEAHQLPIDRLREDDERTPVCDIYVAGDGDRTMFGFGFNDLGRRASIEGLPVSEGAWFSLDGNMGSRGAEAAALAKQAGMRLYAMDIFGPQAEIGPGDYWQSSTDWVGVRGNTQRNVEWVRRFVDETGAFAILSDGPNGLIACAPDRPARHYPPFPAPSYVDSTGSGDMFRAGALYGLSQDWPTDRWMAFASAAGCLKCRSLGATQYVPSVEAIEAHIAANPEVAQRYV